MFSNIRNSLGVEYAQQFEDTVYSVEWSPGVECWSGVLEWSEVKFWSEKVSCFAIYSDKARLYFRKYQENKLSYLIVVNWK